MRAAHISVHNKSCRGVLLSHPSIERLTGHINNIDIIFSYRAISLSIEFIGDRKLRLASSIEGTAYQKMKPSREIPSGDVCDQSIDSLFVPAAAKSGKFN